jgi:hypothetical protein
MPITAEEQGLRDRFFKVLTETALPLQQGPDPEMALEALIDATQLLQEHFQRELAELRQEQAE